MILFDYLSVPPGELQQNNDAVVGYRANVSRKNRYPSAAAPRTTQAHRTGSCLCVTGERGGMKLRVKSQG